jgi:hypothetical protein
MYVFKNMAGQASRKIVFYAIKGDNPWSDHAPVELTLELGDSLARKSRWHMNSLWLEDAREGITATWNHLRPNMPFLNKMKKISQFYRSFCKRKAQFSELKNCSSPSPCGGHLSAEQLT